MAKPETNYRLSIEKRLPKELHHEKMANPWTGGCADSWYDGNKADIWVEWKWRAVLPKRPNTIIIPKWSSALQPDWLRDRYKNGRRVFVIVGSPTGGHIFFDPKGWELGVATKLWANLSRDYVAQWIVKATMRL